MQTNLDNPSAQLPVRIALIDHGVGNIRSVEKALQAVGAQVILTADPSVILAADKVVLPGVGAFGDCMRGLADAGLLDVTRQAAAERPFLGICVGLQMLFDHSIELGEHAGLGVLAGTVERFPHTDLAVPQTGWNRLWPVWESVLLRDIPAGAYAYFNHSYYCKPTDSSVVLALADYGGRYAAIVQRGRLYGIQCHPEKSQKVGLQILRNFVELG